MSAKKGLHIQQHESFIAGGEVTGTSDAREPRKITFGENVLLTIKVLGGFALLGGLLWAIDLWASAK